MAESANGRGSQQKQWGSVDLERLESLAAGLVSKLQEAVSTLQEGLQSVQGTPYQPSGKSQRSRTGNEAASSDRDKPISRTPTASKARNQKPDPPPAWLSALKPLLPKKKTRKETVSPIRLASLSLASSMESNDHHHQSGPFGHPASFHIPIDAMWGGWHQDEDGDDDSDEVASQANAQRSGRDREATTSGGGEADEGEALCYEIVKGRRRRYVKGGGKKVGRGRQAGYTVVEEGEKRNPLQLLAQFASSYVVPEGFPETVSPAYAPYMQWRAGQYFFGGAMGVFTTRSLLTSIGVSRGGAPTAVAVNWAIKDGAGRIGKMLFARQGKKFDCDLKQVRFAGGLLMELGAAVELATTMCPQFFLPLACAANISKNVAAVTATSTRAPIYKAFARRENLGDVTAKGESISNMADLMGMGFGILLSKRNPSLLATFGVLSCGYLLSSYNECRSIQLPTLNRARFSVAVRTFLESGSVPAPMEANRREAIIVPPWAAEKPMELGVKVSDAFGSAQEFQAANQLFKNEKYVVTYRKKKRRAFVVLKEDAKPADVLRAAFQAHVLLHILHGCPSKGDAPLIKSAPVSPPPGLFSLPPGATKPSIRKVSEEDVAAALRQSCNETGGLFDDFRKKASAEGWVMADALLNPGDARLCTSSA